MSRKYEPEEYEPGSHQNPTIKYVSAVTHFTLI